MKKYFIRLLMALFNMKDKITDRHDGQFFVGKKPHKY
jgi:hypothetical protein